MESSSLKISSPQEKLRITNKLNNTNMKQQPKGKTSCKHNNSRGDHQEEDIVEFPWPSSRAYKCGFCERRFRSAQALGGHMNVHRRDRAKLRRRSPPLDSTYHHDHFHGSSSQPIKFLKLYDFSSFNGEEESDGECKIWKKVKTDFLDSSNEIDLELRLGF